MADKQYLREFEFTSDQNNAVMYEDVNGAVHDLVAAGERRRVSKTIWQDTPTPPLSVGDTFLTGGVLATCTRISVTDDVVAVEGSQPSRIWRIDIEGLEGAPSVPTKYLAERSVSRKLNGSIETALDGETVILKRSDNPVTTVSLSCYSTTETPPVAVGGVYDGGIVTGVDTVRTTVDIEGMRAAVLWRHSIEVRR